MVPRHRMEPQRKTRRNVRRLGRTRRKNNIRRHRRMLLCSPPRRLRTLGKRKTPSHSNRTTRSTPRLHHARRRMASKRKRQKRHATKTFNLQHTERSPRKNRNTVHNPNTKLDKRKPTHKRRPVPKKNHRLLPQTVSYQTNKRERPITAELWDQLIRASYPITRPDVQVCTSFRIAPSSNIFLVSAFLTQL